MKNWTIINPSSASPRHRLFMEVAEHAERLLRDKSAELRELRKEITSSPDRYSKIFKILCRPAREKLGATLMEKGFAKFIVAFDECTQLNCELYSEDPQSKETDPYSTMSLIAVQRIIKASDDVDQTQFGTFWHLLLDTNSSVFDLAPVGHNAPSSRLWAELRPLPVWHYLGFDQMVPSSISVDTPRKALELRHILQYGRPVRF